MLRARLFVLIVCLLQCGLSEAHQLPHPKIDEIILTPQGVLAGIRYTLPAGDEPKSLRRLFDENKNGEVDAQEAERLLDYLEISLLSSLTVRLDGERLLLERAVRRGVAIAGQSDRGSEMGIELILKSKEPIAYGLHTIEIFDRGPSLQAPVPVSILWKDGLLPLLASFGQIDFVAGSLGPVHMDGSARLKVVFLAP